MSQLLEVRTDEKPARFYMNGVRISREKWDSLDHGNKDTFLTKCKEIGNGQFVRRNYSHLRDGK